MNKDQYEVIVINDGSTDDCLDIIKRFVQSYDNFHCINQDNSGLSAARNNGLEKSCGEYISFLDGDDFVEPQFLELLYNACVKNGADISYCAHYKYFEKINKKFFVPFTCRTRVMPKQEAMKALIKDNCFRFFAWNKLYKRSILSEHKIHFPDMYFEDIATIPKTIYYCNRVAVLHKGLYNYIKRENSILGSMNVAKVNDYIRSYGSIRNFLEKQGDFDVYKPSYIYSGIRCMLCNYYSIIRLHFLSRNARGIWQNIRNSNRSISYFFGKRFEIYEGDPMIPYPVVPPENKRKNKLKASK
jgi:glycosyltransferase involved in cell wall biosynthesis